MLATNMLTNYSEIAAKNDIPVNREVPGRENEFTKVRSSGTERRSNWKTEKTTAKIQMFELDSGSIKFDWELPSGLFQYINKYMTTHVSERR